MKFFWKYIFPLVFGLLAYFTIRLLTDSISGMKFWYRPFAINAIEIITSILTGYVLIWLVNRVLNYFDQQNRQSFTFQVFKKELFYVIVVSLLVQNAFLTTMAASTDDGLQWYDVADINIIPLFYTLIYYGVRRSVSFLNAYVESKVQLERVTNDHLQTELKFLKAQYHPHFLFNALNTIYFQMDENVQEAKKTVERFSELLRYQLYHQHKQISIGQETRYLESFIKVQQLRVAERLQLKVLFDRSLDNEMVYPLLFLPLVENAFKYVGGDLMIDIRLYREDDNIVFEVKNSVLHPEPPKGDGGIGLENLNRRLELLYPGKYNFRTKRDNDFYIAELKLALTYE